MESPFNEAEWRREKMRELLSFRAADTGTRYYSAAFANWERHNHYCSRRRADAVLKSWYLLGRLDTFRCPSRLNVTVMRCGPGVVVISETVV
jgi:hypothetical protein